MDNPSFSVVCGEMSLMNKGMDSLGLAPTISTCLLIPRTTQNMGMKLIRLW
jgi:hypothetical protein